MLKSILFIAVLFSFVACNLDKLEPAQTKAFMKFFGDEGNNEGVDLLMLNDGFLLLGNNFDGDTTTALLIKTDQNGNRIWSRSFDNISASALAKSANSYFIVGDRINTSNLPTRMSLIKVDLDGGTQYTSLGDSSANYHGTGLTFSRTDQVVVCGYINGSSTITDTTFIYGYNTSLSPAWSAVRKWQTDGDQRISSRALLQDDDGNFVYTSMYGSGNSIQAIKVEEDSPLPIVIDILGDDISTADLGDFSSYNNGGALVQTINNNNGKTAIALVIYNAQDQAEDPVIISTAKNLVAGTVLQASDKELVILGSTDDHGDDENRSDLDFYITKVGFDGTVSSSTGFTNTIGGTGDETGVAIVQAEDKGFVFLGTMLNTNGVKIMVLIKVNINGEMIN